VLQIVRYTFLMALYGQLQASCGRGDATPRNAASQQAHGDNSLACDAVSPSTKLGEIQVQSLLKGRFKLMLQRDDRLTSGMLELTQTKPDRVALGGGATIQPLYGWSPISLDSLGSIQVAISPSQKDTLIPGVQVLYFRRDSSLLLLMGGPMVPEHLTLDAGLVLHVERATQPGFTGHWEAGDSAGNSVRGSFCARRLS